MVVKGETRTFKQGDHVTFAFNSGGPQTLTFRGAEFVGYGQPADFQGRDVKDKLVIWMPNLAAPGGAARGGGPGGNAVNIRGAKAAIGLVLAPTAGRAGAGAGAGRAAESQRRGAAGAGSGCKAAGAASPAGRGAPPVADFTSPQRVDAPMPPQVTGDETLFEALFSDAPVTFADLRAKAQQGEPLSPFSLPAAVTITIDNTFEVVSEQLTRNVVGMVEGTDPALKDTYVLFGAHLDHIGYSQTGNGAQPTPTSCRQRSDTAQAAVRQAGRTVQNPGADAEAAAGGARRSPPRDARQSRGPAQPRRCRRSISATSSTTAPTMMGRERRRCWRSPRRSRRGRSRSGRSSSSGTPARKRGCMGSRYNADFPVVPLDRIQALLNMDMIGRDDCDNLEGDYTNTLFIVGADRISTDLHNLIVETNRTQAKPLTLDYELNDPADPESVYTRSDHYSYAAKGIPIAFFTTGLHPDYHKVSDTVDKILFPKLARIAELVYRTGFSIANTDHVLRRDNKGARTGFGTHAEVLE